MVVLIVSIALQQGSIETIIEQIRNDDISVRDRAQRELLKRWEVWTESELHLLRELTSSSDRDEAALAKECLERITFLRGLPKAIFDAVPNVGSVLTIGTTEDIRTAIVRLDLAWSRGALSGTDFLYVLFSIVEDTRIVDVVPDCGVPFKQEVGRLALELIPNLEPTFENPPSSAKFREWWSNEGRKPDVERLLSASCSSREPVRARALERLFTLNQVEDRWSSILASISSNGNFVYVLRGMSGLSPKQKRDLLTPYLKSSEFSKRFHAAASIFESDKVRAVDAVVEALSSPGDIQKEAFESVVYLEALDWLMRVEQRRGLETVKRILKSKDVDAKLLATGVLCSVQEGDITSLLFELLDDTSKAPGFVSWNGVKNPRICDIAAILINKRIRAVPELLWQKEEENRDLFILEIRRKGIK